MPVNDASSPPAGAGPRRPGRPVAPRSASAGIPLVAAAGGLLLAGAENRWFPAALTPAFALLSYYLVDRGGRWHLPVPAANALGVAALGFAATELVGGDIEGRLLFGAHLIVYLTWVVLCQRKTAKVCWSVLALATLQTAAGSVLTSAGAYGLGLLAFFGLTAWALVRLNARWPHGRRAEPPAAAGTRRASEVEPGEASAAETRVRAWPAAAAVCVVAVPVGAALFLMAPRVWLARRPPIETMVRGRLPAVTGFSGEVALGDLGAILSSSEPAFDVRLTDRRIGRALGAFGPEAVVGSEEPLFRGRVLTIYREGRWSEEGRFAATRLLSTVGAAPRGADLVQEFHLRPLGTPVLFSAAKAAGVTIEGRPTLRVQQWVDDGSLARPPDLPTDRPVRYVVASPPLYDRRPLELLPSYEKDRLLAVPPGLPSVAAEAAAALAAGPPPRENVRGGKSPDRVVAERLVGRLRDSGEFEYSLSGGAADAGAEPLEDFLANRRAGHCEFFASALALMLRDRGIPSRLVTGFKGGDYKELAGRIDVQQRHAHAWVEAFLRDPASPNLGRWATFDPTPAAARAAGVASSGRRFEWAGDLSAAFEALWNTYVVRMSLERQRAAFLAPAEDVAAAVAGAFGDLASAAGGGGGRRWVSGRAGAAAAALLGLLAAAVWGVRRVLGGRWWAELRARRRTRSAVAFYRRFAALAARRGVRRRPDETPREFAPRAAAALADALAPVAGGPDLSDLPATVAADLYRVRFGGAPLPAARAAELDAAMTALAGRLA